MKHKILHLDTYGIISVEVILTTSILLSVLVLCLLHKKQSWFSTESVKGNPYKLVSNVLLFALRHKSPIRRSAFTFSEDERPSRIDFGKQKYGGPYTTEQVEDVKTLLNILMVFISLGPVFLLELSSVLSSIKFSSSQVIVMLTILLVASLIDYGLLRNVLIVVLIPTYHFLLKPFLSRLVPNMFRRMGLSIVLFITFFTALLLFDSLTYYSISDNKTYFETCRINATSYSTKI